MNADLVRTIIGRHALAGCGIFSLLVAELVERGEFSRQELLTALAAGVRLNGTNITVDPKADRVVFVRCSSPAPVATMKPRSVPAPVVPVALDPAAVGAKARAHMDAELAKGNEVSASEAVAVVLGKRAS